MTKIHKTAKDKLVLASITQAKIIAKLIGIDYENTETNNKAYYILEAKNSCYVDVQDKGVFIKVIQKRMMNNIDFDEDNMPAITIFVPNEILNYYKFR